MVTKKEIQDAINVLKGTHFIQEIGMDKTQAAILIADDNGYTPTKLKVTKGLSFTGTEQEFVTAMQGKLVAPVSQVDNGDGTITYTYELHEEISRTKEEFGLSVASRALGDLLKKAISADAYKKTKAGLEQAFQVFDNTKAV